MAPKLTYFAFRALGEPIILTLEHAGVKYEFNGISRESLAEVKASGRLPFGQVPIYEEDDGFLISQSSAIIRYIARKNGLYGSDERQGALIDQFSGGLVDIQSKFFPIAFKGVKKPEAQTFLAEELPKWLNSLEKLATNAGTTAESGFAIGPLSFADFHLFFMLDLLSSLVDIQQWKVLAGIKDRVANLPNIAAYINSERRNPALQLPE